MKFFGRSTALLFLWPGLGLSVTGLNRIAEAAEADKLNVCYSSIAATSFTTWVPKEAGIYKKYGLDQKRPTDFKNLSLKARILTVFMTF